MIKFDILSLFPEMFDGILKNSILKRAIEKKLIEVNIINFRDFANNKHNTVDDYAYGGGAGMLISVAPIHRALMSIEGIENAHKIITTPTGKVFNQQIAENLKDKKHFVIVCGHYEGLDARVNEYMDEEISIGDYVLTGGELPAMIIMDAISRLVDGVISEDSITGESHTTGLLEHPQYTRPYEYDGKVVPDVLMSGHHKNIESWRRFESLKKTYHVRPDLLKNAPLSKEDLKMLEEIKKG